MYFCKLYRRSVDTSWNALLMTKARFWVYLLTGKVAQQSCGNVADSFITNYLVNAFKLGALTVKRYSRNYYIGVEHAETRYKVNAILLWLRQLEAFQFKIDSTCFWFKVRSGAKQLSCNSRLARFLSFGKN